MQVTILLQFSTEVTPQNRHSHTHACIHTYARKGPESYVPSRLLKGLLPAALLRRFVFWRSDRDACLKGYPIGA